MREGPSISHVHLSNDSGLGSSKFLPVSSVILLTATKLAVLQTHASVQSDKTQVANSLQRHKGAGFWGHERPL